MRLGKRAYSLLVFLGVAILGGVLAAGFAVPVVSMATSTGKDAALSLDALPTDLEPTKQAERSKVLLADGSLLTYFYNENRLYEPLANISPIMQEAQVSIEDHRFFEHGAIDLQGTMRALVSTSQGVTQGGSSITQQYVRLILIEAAEEANDPEARASATENTMARKIRELRYAIALEENYSKEEILEGYLNISYYGDGAYGVEAAARHYFGVSAKDLNLAQAAMLAGLVRNPVTTNPVKYPDMAIERRNNVIDRMVELGKVTKAEGEAAKEEPFDKSKVTQNRLDCGNSKYPFICEYAKQVLLSDQTPSLGDTPEERLNRLFRGGLTIQLTIDPKIQKNSEKTLNNFIDPRDPVVGVITMVEPSTGRIVSMAQSRPKMGNNLDAKGKDDWRGETYYNYAVTHAMGGSDGFQGGSTFKAFIAAAALENGMGAYGKYNAKQHMEFEGPFKSCDGEFMLTKPWKVNNAGGTGIRDMFGGVTNSVNTYFAQLIQAVGGCESVKMADKLGLELGKPSPGHPDVLSYDSTPAITLGSMDITPLSMVEAYSTFANRGKHCEPIIISSMQTRQGAELKVPEANCEQVISKDVADAINKIFQGPFRSGTAAPARIPGVQMAGKTGTVSDNRSVWTVGYTPELAVAAMYSYDKDPRFAKFWTSQGGDYLRGAYLKYSKQRVRGVSGGEAGAKLLKPAMQYALKSYDTSATFSEPPASILKGEWNRVPSCDNVSVGTCKSKLRKAGFTYFTDEVASDAAKGTLVGTSPSGKAPKLSAIAIQISKGPKKGSEAWCKLDGNGGKSECVKYLPPPTCNPGEVLVPNPPPGRCEPQQPTHPGGPGRGNGGG